MHKNMSPNKNAVRNKADSINGAAGGKLIGAGGGGFFMFYCNNSNNDKPKLAEAMQKMGLTWERFRFDFDGAKILVNT